MSNYTKPLLQALVGLLKKGIQSKHEPLQTEVLNVLHSVCSVILSDFGVYYNDFMPLMTEILQNVGSETMEDKKLRAKTIDTMGSIIIAVSDCDNKDVFKGSVIEVTSYLAQMLHNGMSNDDPQDEAVKNTLTQCAGFLQKDFAQFMPVLMQQLVNDANLEVDFKIENADMPSSNPNQGFNVKIKGLGEQRVSVKTEALVKKTGAFGLMEQISENMGTAFAPYVEPLLPIITAHMTYTHSHAIRKFALKTFKNMLIAVGEQYNIQLF